MDANEAWDAFYKSQAVQKASVSEKLDVIAAQVNEMQTTMDRLATTIPEQQGDAAAMETANNTPPMGGAPDMGALFGAEDEGAEEMPQEDVPPQDEEQMEAAPEAPGAAGEALPDNTDVAEGGAAMPADNAGGDGADASDMDDEEDYWDDELNFLGGDEISGGGLPTGAGGESNGMVERIKGMISRTSDPEMLKDLGELLAEAASTGPAQSMETQEADYSEEEAAPEEEETLSVSDDVSGTMKSDSVAKADKEGGTPEPTMEPKDGEAGKNDLQEAPGADAPENSVDEASPEDDIVGKIVSKIMEAVQGIVQECLGEGPAPEDGPEEEMPEDAEDAEEVKVDDEDADTHIDVEDGGKVEVEGGGMTEDEKLDRNEELSDDSAPFADSMRKSFKDLLKGRIETHVGVDGQFAKGCSPTASVDESDCKTEENGVNDTGMGDESINEGYPASWSRGSWRNNIPTPDYATKVKREEAKTKMLEHSGREGREYAQYVEPESQKEEVYRQWAKDRPKKENPKSKLSSQDISLMRDKSVVTSDGDEAVSDTGLNKSASDNGKHIETMAERQAVAKSERADTIATTNGSLTPPNLEGAAPLRMTSFREMMGKSKGE